MARAIAGLYKSLSCSSGLPEYGSSMMGSNGIRFSNYSLIGQICIQGTHTPPR